MNSCWSTTRFVTLEFWITGGSSLRRHSATMNCPTVPSFTKMRGWRPWRRRSFALSWPLQVRLLWLTYNVLQNNYILDTRVLDHDAVNMKQADAKHLALGPHDYRNITKLLCLPVSSFLDFLSSFFPEYTPMVSFWVSECARPFSASFLSPHMLGPCLQVHYPSQMSEELLKFWTVSLVLFLVWRIGVWIIRIV